MMRLSLETIGIRDLYDYMPDTGNPCDGSYIRLFSMSRHNGDV